MLCVLPAPGCHPQPAVLGIRDQVSGQLSLQPLNCFLPSPSPLCLCAPGNGQLAMPHQQKPLVYILMGVCGCGKSTVGALLAAALGCPFYDADSFHSAANISEYGLVHLFPRSNPRAVQAFIAATFCCMQARCGQASP